MFQSQDLFNKMGRYHLSYNEILNMFMQLLKDLNHFNVYIKKSVGKVMKNLRTKTEIEKKKKRNENNRSL